jgi:hypothetical protein
MFNRSGNGISAAPGLIVSMSFQLAIPQRIALQWRTAAAVKTDKELCERIKR